jgi:hypothetical protein
MTAVLGNGKADREAKQAALTGEQTSASLAAALFPCPLSEWDSWYTSQEQAGFETEGGNFLADGWWKFTDGHIAIPESLAPTFVNQFHEGTHSGQTLWRPPWPNTFMSPSSAASIRQNVKGAVCARNNPQQGPRCKYLLVFVCTYSR